MEYSDSRGDLSLFLLLCCEPSLPLVDLHHAVPAALLVPAELPAVATDMQACDHAAGLTSGERQTLHSWHEYKQLRNFRQAKCRHMMYSSRMLVTS